MLRPPRTAGRYALPGLVSLLLAVGLMVIPGKLAHTAAAPGAATAGTSSGTSSSARPSAGSRSRPNIVLITSDDQTDTELRWMPKTRRLLTRAGIDFRDGLNPHPLCCPARAEILTGEYAQNNGVRSNRGAWGGYAAFSRNNHQENLAVWLRRAGYRTAFVGKTMNGYRDRSRRTAGWDFWSPTLAGTYGYYGTEFENNGAPRRWGNKYVADIVRDETNRLIRQWAPSRKPFFIWASHVGPHDSTTRGKWGPPIPAKRHASMFGTVKLPTRNKPSFGERNTSDKPHSVRASTLPSRLVWRFRQRIRSLQAIDEANAATIRALRRARALDDTLIAYVSDNGYQLGEHNLYTKNHPYAESLQIPFLMRGPGIPRGATSDQTASMVDLAPTFLDAAGVLGRVRRAGHTDGETLLPVAAGRATLNSTTLIQAGPITAKQVRTFGWMFRGVRTSRYTWVVWWNGFEELYDHARDPYELDNLTGHRGRLRDPAYLAVRDELRSRYQRLRSCAGYQACERRAFGPEPVPLIP